MKKILIVVMAVIILVMAAACSGGADVEADVETLSEGDKVPDFTAELAGGGTFRMSDHKDDVVLLNVWATWCGYCVEEMPDIQKIKDENIDGVSILLVDCSETKEEVDDFLKENSYTFDVAYDENADIWRYFSTGTIPSTAIIKDGVVEKLFVGYPGDPYNVYKSAIEECLE